MLNTKTYSSARILYACDKFEIFQEGFDRDFIPDNDEFKKVQKNWNLLRIKGKFC